MPTVDEDGQYTSPAPLRLPRKPLGRSLSSVVASLRKLEEEKLDDELEALHEMENEDISSSVAKPAMPAPKAPPETEKILEPDSQAPQLLGGFDDEGLYDSAPEEGKGRDGQPLRVYKKKGQKRTTRRVNMRPTRAKRPEQAVGEDDHAAAATGEASVGEGDDVVEIVPETQFELNNKPAAEDGPGVDSDYSDFDDLDELNEEVPKAKKPKAAAAKSKKKDDKDDKEEGKVKKAVRKVNELAHANFKRLKLKNHGSKGGPGFGSRFRRRR